MKKGKRLIRLILQNQKKDIFSDISDIIFSVIIRHIPP